MVPEIDVGGYVERFIRFLQDNFDPVFSAISNVLGGGVDGLTDILMLGPPIVVALIAGVLAGWLRSYWFGIFTIISFLLIESMNLWEEAMNTLSLVLIATLAAIIIAIPLGIAATRNSAVSTAMRPVLDFMQTLPAFVYLIPAIFFFGVGVVPGAVATLVFAMPPAVRLTELGIRGVDSEVVEAAEAFGATPNQILFRVQIPLALPTIMAGVNQVIMLALSMVVIAGMVGAGGLGAVVFRAISRIDIGLGFEGGLAVVILAIFLDRVTETLGTRGGVQSSIPGGTA
jgi:ABC-type proline/glycine betaine transport system permease subunit